jgi:DNA-directed RNA polymerase specialized sigma24 family protein
VYLPEPDGGSGAEHAAQALGLTPEAVRQRCSRARRRLINAVGADLATTTITLAAGA